MPSELNTKPPFQCSAGPQDAKIVIVGECFGKEEALLEKPFMGHSGQELTKLLKEAGIARRDCLLTNALNLRPPMNKDGKFVIENLCGGKKEVGEGYSVPPLSHGKYLRPEYLPELDRLREEILAHPRNLIIALGNTACWALLGAGGIQSRRGVVANSTLCPGIKVIPSYHPAAVLRTWAWRPILLADLLKAKRESESPEIVRPKRWLLVDPTLAEIECWIEDHAQHCSSMAVDIETRNGQITDIGFASSPSQAISIPFVRNFKDSAWATPEEELLAWNLVERLLMLPCEKVFQNGLYDLQYIYKLGLRVCNAGEDTMLLHHVLYPELNKGLAFLGSIYTLESAWKLNYRRARKEEAKADE